MTRPPTHWLRPRWKINFINILFFLYWPPNTDENPFFFLTCPGRQGSGHSCDVTPMCSAVRFGGCCDPALYQTYTINGVVDSGRSAWHANQMRLCVQINWWRSKHGYRILVRKILSFILFFNYFAKTATRQVIIYTPMVRYTNADTTRNRRTSRFLNWGRTKG